MLAVELEVLGEGRPELVMVRIPGKFPAFAETIRVYATIVSCIYPWSILSLFRDYSARWRLFMTVGDLTGLAAYTLLVNFLESALMLSILVLAAGLLPRRLLSEDFALRACLIAASFLLSIMAFTLAFPIGELRSNLLLWLASFLVMSSLLVNLAGKHPALRSGVLAFAEKLTVFLFLFLPLSAIALLVVIARNLG